MVQSLNAHEGLNTAWLIAGFAIDLLLIFLRDPSLFTRPQFWAEDGKVWYAQAYNQGWLHSLTQPLGGYLNTLQRLGAGAALLVPFRWAPLVMALEGPLLSGASGPDPSLGALPQLGASILPCALRGRVHRYS
jgi:hypothetical protein